MPNLAPGLLVLLAIAACGPTAPRRPAAGDGPDAGTRAADAAAELCGNGADDDHDGAVDEGCACYPGSMQACFAGDPSVLGHGACQAGTQACEGDGEVGQWTACTGAVGPTPELCNHLDDDCDGVVDNLPGNAMCVIVDVAVNIDGDCVTASCPPATPYPIGCNITMQGNDTRGCVASTPLSSTVYFQEGDRCGVGHVGGTLQCASAPGSPLDAQSCTINKADRYYPTSPAGCPAI